MKWKIGFPYLHANLSNGQPQMRMTKQYSMPEDAVTHVTAPPSPLSTSESDAEKM